MTKKVTGCAKMCLVFDKNSAQSTFLPLIKIFIRSECISQGVFLLTITSTKFEVLIILHYKLLYVFYSSNFQI